MFFEILPKVRYCAWHATLPVLSQSLQHPMKQKTLSSLRKLDIGVERWEGELVWPTCVIFSCALSLIPSFLSF
jgi:hypothetical protein